MTHLSVIDYVVFTCLLLFSALIGVYYACTGGKQKTASEFLMANRRMGVTPVALSLLASFMSAITLLGIPSEMYSYGTHYLMIGGSYVTSICISSHVTLPIFYRMRITSAYEYLEKRFHKCCRLAGAITIILQMITYMGVVLYAPALALNAVTGLSWTMSLLLLGTVCTFYTTIGGMKAVMWTDVFQTIIMFTGMIVVVIIGLIEVGGWTAMWTAIERGNRVEFFNFDPNPLTRHTVWSLVLGGTFTWLVIYGINQSQVQRYCAAQTMRKAQIALWLNVPGLVALLIICGLTGLIAYAYYENCDPLSAQRIGKSDQILPLFVMDVCSKIPGFPGLFISAIFSGAMSTVSSGLNSLAAITLEDVIKPYFLPLFNGYSKAGLSEERGAIASKILAFTYGLIAIGMAFAASRMGNIVQAALGIFGMVGGPLLGVFLLGMFFSCANWKGAIIGHILGAIATLWVGLGGFIYQYPHKRAPFHVTDCPLMNITVNSTHLNLSLAEEEQLRADYEGLDIYRLSYMWQGTFGVLATVIIGLLVSAVTGFSKKDDVDPDLLFSLCRRRVKSRKNTRRLSSHIPDIISQPKEYQFIGLPLSSSEIPLKQTTAAEWTLSEDEFSDSALPQRSNRHRQRHLK